MVDTATIIGESRILRYVLNFVMVLLSILREENKSHAFASDIADLLISRQNKSKISNERARELFCFLRLIVKDKIAQVEALGEYESDSLIDIESEVENLIDKQLKAFLKLTFKLYFDFSMQDALRKECQMLILSALELQEKVN